MFEKGGRDLDVYPASKGQSLRFGNASRCTYIEYNVEFQLPREIEQPARL